jgi:hypothetical protein
MINSKGDIIFGAALECLDARQMRKKEAERTYRKKTATGPNDPDGAYQSNYQPANVGTRESIRERRPRITNADEDLERGGKRDRGGSFRAIPNAAAAPSSFQPETQESAPTPVSYKFEMSSMFAPTLEGLFHPADPVPRRIAVVSPSPPRPACIAIAPHLLTASPPRPRSPPQEEDGGSECEEPPDPAAAAAAAAAADPAPAAAGPAAAAEEAGGLSQAFRRDWEEALAAARCR